MDYMSVRKREFETTLRVLQAYPDDQVAMKPAAKSRTAAELAMTLVGEERVIKTLIETGATDPKFPSTDRRQTSRPASPLCKLSIVNCKLPTRLGGRPRSSKHS